MKIDVTKIRPVFSKIDPQVMDPVRYPNVINGYEKQAKRTFADTMNMMISDVTKKMVELKK